MKVLMINGSPRKNGNTMVALQEMQKIFEANDVEVEILHVGGMDIRGCIACGKCERTKGCVLDGFVNEVAEKLRNADGLVLGSPVYYASANPTLVALLDRLFYSSGLDCTMKVGASVLAARRGGITAAFDELNKFIVYHGMALAGGQYWNGIHGRNPGEALQDAEGLQQMRTLANNMVFLMKSIALGKEKYGIPQKEKWIGTNFIR